MKYPRSNFVNPTTRLTMGGMLDILSLAKIHGVEITISWSEENEYYILTVSEGDRIIRESITDAELDSARSDELWFRHRLHYAIHRLKCE